MDITQTTAAKSDQQNYDDYAAGITRTVTVTEVKGGSPEQPVEILLAEYPGRPYKPSKSMRRVLVSAWGSETSAYVGRKMTLYGDPNVKFGGIAVGGIKISHLSHIDKPLKIALTVTRGKREPFIVQPLINVVTKESLENAGADMGARRESVITEKQLNFIGGLMKQLGMTDKESALDYVRIAINREVDSSAELSSFEGSTLIKALENKLAAEAESNE